MLTVPVKDLLEAGVHFGCRASRWNPRMKPFIFGRKNQIHIIDLKETLRGLIKATTFLHRLSAEGHQILFVGTKRQAQSVIAECARKVSMPFVNERWLGGTLTNFTTVRMRLGRLTELEATEKAGIVPGMSKKAMASLMREKRKIFRNLDGIRNMEKLPGALVIVDSNREHNAVKEASKLGIPVVAILDTDCDPSRIDIPIPGNDDSMRSVQILLGRLTDAIGSGLTAYAQWLQEEEKRRQEEANRKAEEDRKLRDVQKKRAAEREQQLKAQHEQDAVIRAAAAKYRAEKEGKGDVVSAPTTGAAPKPAAPAKPAPAGETKPGPAGPEPTT